MHNIVLVEKYNKIINLNIIILREKNFKIKICFHDTLTL